MGQHHQAAPKACIPGVGKCLQRFELYRRGFGRWVLFLATWRDGARWRHAAALVAVDPAVDLGLGALEVGGGSGISARDSADISVTNSRFRDATGGVSFNNVLGGRIAGNDFRDLWYDAIHVDTTGRIAVENNTITDFRGPPLHLDAIQFSCAKATTPVAGLVIRGNRYTRGTGSPAQFIFMSDCAPGYTDFKITGNADFGGAFHGVTIVKASNGEIGDNFLQASSALWAGQLLVPGIRLDLPGPGVVVRDDNRWAGTGLKPAEDTTGLVAWTRRLDDPRDVALAAAQAAIADLKAQLASALKGGDDSRAVAASLQSALDLATARGAALEARLAGVAAMAATPVP